ncbi:carboxypeptidase regulatory-like domain-containing protein [Corallococcus sp. CA054B]|nr:carboxypeptidase regulatory-like domain-containing protein [Corallococcus sp. CA054B]
MRWNWVGIVVMALACAGPERGVRAAEATLTIQVEDVEGRPVRDARLRVLRTDDPEETPVQSGTTDRQGLARMHPAAGRYVVRVDAKDFVSLLRADVRVAPAASAHLGLRLRHAVRIEGRVRDAAGKPVADARWLLIPSDGTAPRLETRSDAQGRFHFEGVLPGPAVLRGFKPGRSPVRMELTLPRPELTVTMGGLGSLRIQTRDPQGRPLPGKPQVLPPDGEEFVLSIDSRFGESQDPLIHPGLPAGRYRVKASYSPVPDCKWTRTVSVDVLPDQQTQVTVGFEDVAPMPAWRGRAVDRGGRGLGGVKLSSELGPRGFEVEGLHAYCQSVTDPEGNFVLAAPLPGPVSLYLEGGGPRSWGLVEPREAWSDAPWVFQSHGGTLRGRVLDSQGRPVERFRVSDWPFESAEGRYVMDTFYEQTYQWIIDAEGFATAILRAQGRAHEDAFAPDVILDAGRPLQGRVVAADGRTGVPQQRVVMLDDSEHYLRPPPASARSVTTDARGYFRFEHVPARRQFLLVEGKERGTALRRLEPAEDTVELRLAPAAELSGVVTVHASVPLAGMEVDVYCEGGAKESTQTDARGRYALRAPAERECFAHVSERSSLDTLMNPPRPVVFSPQRIQLAAGSRARLDFEARRGPASLHLHSPAYSEILKLLLLPWDVPMPETTQALDALELASIDEDPGITEANAEVLAPAMVSFSAPDRIYSEMPLGHYTLFLLAERNGGSHVLRVPVDLTRTGMHPLELSDPMKGGATVFPR